MPARKKRPGKFAGAKKVVGEWFKSTLFGTKFENESSPLTESELAYARKIYGDGAYAFDGPPKHLFMWSRLFQSVISQAGTYLCKREFHDKQCSIYKTEGGCYIPGVGDLVLTARYPYWDGGRSDKNSTLISDLISKVVLEWDPMNPIDSMIEVAAREVRVTPEALKEAVEKSSNGGVFGGNALADFFNWNPFNKPPIDDEYYRFCCIEINEEDVAVVEQRLADRKLGYELLEKMLDKGREYIKKNGVRCMCLPMCCSPKRTEKGLAFWINTGRSTQLDGLKTQKEIEEYLKTDGRIVETR